MLPQHTREYRSLHPWVQTTLAHTMVPWVAATGFELVARQTSSPTSTSATPTSTTPSTTTSSSSSGIFDFGGSSSASPTATGPPGSHRSIPQLALEWVVAFIAVAVLLSLVFCRFAQLRRQGRSVSQIFSRTPARPTSPGLRPFHHSIRHPYNHPSGPGSPNNHILLPNQPLHSAIHSDALFTIPTLPGPGGTATAGGGRGRGNRGVRGADTDAQGRREGPVDPEEHGEGIEKETLPAYDAGQKGPPRYVDVMFNPFNRGPGGFAGGGGPLHPSASTSPNPNPDVGEEVELTRLGIPIPDRHPADRPLGDPFEDEHRLSQTTTRETTERRDPSPSYSAHSHEPQTTSGEENHPDPDRSAEHLTMPEPHPAPMSNSSPSLSTER